VLLSGSALLVGSWRYRDSNAAIGKSWWWASKTCQIWAWQLGSLAAWQGRAPAMALGMTCGLCRTGEPCMAAAKFSCPDEKCPRGAGKLPAFHKDTPARHRTSWSWRPDWLHFSGTATCVPAAASAAVPANTAELHGLG
jgi:hypothetical protein